MNDDPLWYDRIEADEPPGPILRTLAIVYITATWVYWLPETFWQLTARRIALGPIDGRRS